MIEQQDHSNEPSNQHRHLLLITITVGLGFAIEWLDAFALNTALPNIAKDFGVPILELKYILTAYLLSLALFVPISGAVCDRIGIIKTYSCAMGLFMIGSIGASIASNLTMMTLSRIIQGIGGSCMMPVVL